MQEPYLIHSQSIVGWECWIRRRWAAHLSMSNAVLMTQLTGGKIAHTRHQHHMKTSLSLWGHRYLWNCFGCP